MDMKPSTAVHSLEQAGLRPPLTLTIAITGVCNLYCSHCWVEAGGAYSASHVPTRIALPLLDAFAAMRGTGVRITGGEPLCHPDWLVLMRRACVLGFHRVALQTNGMLLTDDDVRALRTLDFPGLSIQVSLDGAEAATHDLVRGKGAFDRAVAGIMRLADGGLASRITIAFTEMRHNLEEFPALLELATDLGVASVVAGTLITGGRGGNADLAPPTPDQYLLLLARYDADDRFRDLYDAFGTMAALEWRRGDGPREACCTFAENPYLTPDGRLYPCLLCHTDDHAVSGVFEKGLVASFAEGAPLWASLRRISQSRADALRECRECPGKLSCAGGCMGRAWGSCGDLLAADDRCAIRRAVNRAAESIASKRPRE